MGGDGKEWTNIGLRWSPAELFQLPQDPHDFDQLRRDPALRVWWNDGWKKDVQKGGCNFWRAGVSIAMLQEIPLRLDSELMYLLKFTFAHGPLHFAQFRTACGTDCAR